MKLSFRHRSLAIAVAVTATLSCLGLYAARAFDDTYELIDTYYRVQDEVLFPTEIGRHYIDNFYGFSNEAWQISLAHPAVMNEAGRILYMFEAPLRALVEGEGSEVFVTPEMVIQVETFLDHLAEYAGPELLATIQTERTRVPLSSLVGMSFDEGRLLLLGPPEPNPPGTPPTRIPMPTAE
jgi:hypothetical protein